jgi:phosphohistidine phosphatase
MTELYVVRHGIAVDRGTSGGPDNERPLTQEGRKRMREIGRGLRRLGIEPDKIVTSPLPRARETAEIVAGALGMSNRLEVSETLKDDRTAAAVRDWLESRGEGRLMVVGHNPALSELVGLLAVGSTDPWLCELKKGGVAALSTRADGGFALDWIAPPRLLRLLGDS